MPPPGDIIHGTTDQEIKQCDKKKPVCGQCMRKGIECPGYRDPSVFVFRDQTAETARRAANHPSDALIKHPSSELSMSRDTLKRPKKPPVSYAIPRPLPVSIEAAALDHFFKFYAPVGALKYLKHLSTHFATSGQPKAALLAPALAVFAQELNQPALKRFAMMQYSAAVRDTNHALSTPGLATEDATLGSVILLGLYEALTFDGSKSPTNWANHIEGALQLVGMRSDAQFDTTLGRALFIDVADCARLSYHKRLIPVPPSLIRLEKKLRKEGPLEGDMSHISDGIAAMIAGMTDKSSDRYQPVRVVAQGRLLELEIRRFTETLWDMQPYTQHHDATAYNGIAHSYNSAHGGRHWNGLRLMAMFVNKWICRAANEAIAAQLSGFQICDISEMTGIIEAATGQVNTMAEDVLRSIPFFKTQAEARCSSVAFARWLIWPLTVVATSTLVPDEARLYAELQLQSCKEVVGIKQAEDQSAEPARPDDWYVSKNFFGFLQNINYCQVASFYSLVVYIKYL